MRVTERHWLKMKKSKLTIIPPHLPRSTIFGGHPQLGQVSTSSSSSNVMRMHLQETSMYAHTDRFEAAMVVDSTPRTLVKLDDASQLCRRPFRLPQQLSDTPRSADVMRMRMHLQGKPGQHWCTWAKQKLFRFLNQTFAQQHIFLNLTYFAWQTLF